MRITKPLTAILTVLLISVFGFGMIAAADESSELDELKDSINTKLTEGTSSEAQEIIGDFELDVGDPDSISGITVRSVLEKIISLFFGNISSPMKVLGKLLAVSVLCTLAGSLSAERLEISGVYRIIGSLAAILSVYDCLQDCISVTASCLNELTVFMLSYIPVYAGITSAAGHIVQGTSFYGTNLFLCEAVAFIAKSVLSPLLSILIAFSVVGAVNPDIKLGKAAGTVKRAITWGLGILMTVFTGVLSIHNAVGAASDSARTKAIRFAASSFIPIIGGSVSETYSALRGSLGIIKAGTGSIGVILIAAIVLKPIIVLISARAVLAIGGLMCEILGQNEIAAFVSNISSIIAIALSIVICVSIMFIISTCIVMMTATGTGA